MGSNCEYCGTGLTAVNCINCGAGNSFPLNLPKPKVEALNYSGMRAAKMVTRKKYGGCAGSIVDLMELTPRTLSIVHTGNPGS